MIKLDLRITNISSLTFPQELDGDALRSEPLIYCHFAKGVGESRYLAVSSWESLNQILEEALESYNELNAIMNLVLFEDAMQHVYVKDISLIRVSHRCVCFCVCTLLYNLSDVHRVMCLYIYDVCACLCGVRCTCVIKSAKPALKQGVLGDISPCSRFVKVNPK